MGIIPGGLQRMTKYHFTGIKGSGMSPLAQILHDEGHEVQGSDIEKYFFTEKPLHERNINVLLFDENNISEDMTIIAGNAFPDTHPEIVKAKELGLEVVRYHKFLGEYMNQFTSIAVTGAHGKTSTTGLLAHVLSGYSPTAYLIGDGTGKGVENASNFVFEACEYRRHFLAYSPDYAIMTNIDFDHPDYFSDIEDVFNAFQEMAMQVKKCIIACGDDAHLQRIKASVPVVYYGFGEHNNFDARNNEKTTEGTCLDEFVRNEIYHRFTIPMYGDHVILNTLSVISLCHYEGVPAEVIQSGLESFEGVKRRFTETVIENRVIIDDYAHHPTEIAVTIQGARQKYPDRELVVIFQPHTYTRTQKFLNEFKESLSLADEVYLCDIFGSARENTGTLTIETLGDLIEGSHILQEDNVEQLLNHENAVYMFMGAGDVQKYQQAFEKKLNN